MSTNNHKVNDIVLLTEDFQLQEDTTKVVKLDEEMFGFVFYLSGMISVDVTQNKKESSLQQNNRTTTIR